MNTAASQEGAKAQAVSHGMEMGLRAYCWDLELLNHVPLRKSPGLTVVGYRHSPDNYEFGFGICSLISDELIFREHNVFSCDAGIKSRGPPKIVVCEVDDDTILVGLTVDCSIIPVKKIGDRFVTQGDQRLDIAGNEDLTSVGVKEMIDCPSRTGEPTIVTVTSENDTEVITTNFHCRGAKLTNALSVATRKAQYSVGGGGNNHRGHDGATYVDEDETEREDTEEDEDETEREDTEEDDDETEQDDDTEEEDEIEPPPVVKPAPLPAQTPIDRSKRDSIQADLKPAERGNPRTPDRDPNTDESPDSAAWSPWAETPPDHPRKLHEKALDTSLFPKEMTASVLTKQSSKKGIDTDKSGKPRTMDPFDAVMDLYGADKGKKGSQTSLKMNAVDMMRELVCDSSQASNNGSATAKHKYKMDMRPLLYSPESFNKGNERSQSMSSNEPAKDKFRFGVSKSAVSGNDTSKNASGNNTSKSMSSNEPAKPKVCTTGNKVPVSGNDTNKSMSSNEPAKPKFCTTGNKVPVSGNDTNKSASGNDTSKSVSSNEPPKYCFTANKGAASGNDTSKSASGNNTSQNLFCLGPNKAATGSDKSGNDTGKSVFAFKKGKSMSVSGNDTSKSMFGFERSNTAGGFQKGKSMSMSGNDTSKGLFSNDQSQSLFALASNETSKSMFGLGTGNSTSGNDTSKSMFAYGTGNSLPAFGTGNDTGKSMFGSNTANSVPSNDTSKNIFGTDINKSIFAKDTSKAIFGSDTGKSVFATATGGTEEQDQAKSQVSPASGPVFTIPVRAKAKAKEENPTPTAKPSDTTPSNKTPTDSGGPVFTIPVRAKAKAKEENPTPTAKPSDTTPSNKTPTDSGAPDSSKYNLKTESMKQLDELKLPPRRKVTSGQKFRRAGSVPQVNSCAQSSTEGGNVAVAAKSCDVDSNKPPPRPASAVITAKTDSDSVAPKSQVKPDGVESSDDEYYYRPNNHEPSERNNAGSGRPELPRSVKARHVPFVQPPSGTAEVPPSEFISTAEQAPKPVEAPPESVGAPPPPVVRSRTGLPPWPVGIPDEFGQLLCAANERIESLCSRLKELKSVDIGCMQEKPGSEWLEIDKRIRESRGAFQDTQQLSETKECELELDRSYIALFNDLTLWDMLLNARRAGNVRDTITIVENVRTALTRSNFNAESDLWAAARQLLETVQTVRAKRVAEL